MALIENLMKVGLSRLEAEIYIELQKNPFSTGYKIANSINEPLSNTYKAIESLVKKKCIIVYQNKKTKNYSAVNISTIISQKEEELKKQKEILETEINKISNSIKTEGIYLLNSIEDVFEKAKTMIENANTNIIIDSYPEPLIRVKEIIEKVSNKGIDIIIESSSSIQIEGCEIIEPENYIEDQNYWPCDWFNIAVDGEEFILAFLKKNGEGVFHAVWSKSPYLALMIYYSFVQEIQQLKLKKMFKDNLNTKEIERRNTELYNRLFSKIPGNRKIKDIMLMSV